MIRLDHNDIPPTDEPFKEMPSQLDGYWWETDHQICIPVIMSHSPRSFLLFLSEQEGKGKAVVFPTVISGRLEKLLRLRGYVDSVVYDFQMEIDHHCLTLYPEKVQLTDDPTI